MGGFTAALQRFGIGRLAVVLGVAAGVAAVLVALMLRVARPRTPCSIPTSTCRKPSEITAALDQAGIKYSLEGRRLDHHGQPRRGRRGPADAVAGKGLPTSGSVGYEIFDNQSALGQTDFQQNLNDQRALEGELARTILSHARHHLRPRA